MRIQNIFVWINSILFAVIKTIATEFAASGRSQLLAAIDGYVTGNSGGYPRIGLWDVSQINDFSECFYYHRSSNTYEVKEALSTFNEDISQWNVSNAITMARMFEGAVSFNRNLSRWNTGRVVDMSYMFADATSFNGDISSWDTSSVTNMAWMFSCASSFNGNVSRWDVSKVQSLLGMFEGTESFNPGRRDLEQWNVANTTSMAYMFSRSSSFNADISNWRVSNLRDASHMFYEASSFNRNLCSWIDKLRCEVYLESMFLGTNCPSEDNPQIYNVSSVGVGYQHQTSFCHDCVDPKFCLRTPSAPEENECFSPETKTYVLGKGGVPMKDLHVGDSVLTKSGEYKMVYTIDHVHQSKPTRYIQIHTELNDENEHQPLKMTPNHMVFIQEENFPVPASHIKIGQTIQSVQGPIKVTQIEHIIYDGMYNPVTTDGTIIVDGLIMASTYNSYIGSTHALETDAMKLLPMHTVKHLASNLYGVFCTAKFALLGKVNEENGNRLAGTTMIMRQIFFFWLEQNTIVKVGCMIAYMTVLGFITIIFKFHFIIMIAVLILMCSNIRRRTRVCK